MGIVYDAGALIAAERNQPRFLALHRRALAERQRPVVSTVVLGQVWRGTARQAGLAQVLKSCTVLDLDTGTAKLGGQLCGLAGTADLADAVVTVLAIERQAKIVTSDPRDIDQLGVAAGWQLTILPI